MISRSHNPWSTYRYRSHLLSLVSCLCFSTGWIIIFSFKDFEVMLFHRYNQPVKNLTVIKISFFVAVANLEVPFISFFLTFKNYYFVIKRCLGTKWFLNNNLKNPLNVFYKFEDICNLLKKIRDSFKPELKIKKTCFFFLLLSSA